MRIQHNYYKQVNMTPYICTNIHHSFEDLKLMYSKLFVYTYIHTLKMKHIVTPLTTATCTECALAF